MSKNIFTEEDKHFERRSHGCDGCRNSIPTERFDGYCGSHLWLCNKCYKKIVSKKLNQFANQKESEVKG